jgi:hypothetical protein
MTLLEEFKVAAREATTEFDMGRHTALEYFIHHHHRELAAAMELAESCRRIPASANFGRGDAEVFSIAAFKTYRAAKTKELQNEQDRND